MFCTRSLAAYDAYIRRGSWRSRGHRRRLPHGGIREDWAGSESQPRGTRASILREMSRVEVEIELEQSEARTNKHPLHGPHFDFWRLEARPDVDIGDHRDAGAWRRHCSEEISRHGELFVKVLATPLRDDGAIEETGRQRRRVHLDKLAHSSDEFYQEACHRSTSIAILWRQETGHDPVWFEWTWSGRRANAGGAACLLCFAGSDRHRDTLRPDRKGTISNCMVVRPIWPVYLWAGRGEWWPSKLITNR